MHSRRMGTTRSSHHREGLHSPSPGADHPPEQAPRDRSSSTSPLAVGLNQIPSTSPLAVGLDQIPLNFPLGCGPGPDPPQLPPWLWAWTRSPSTSSLAVGLETPPRPLETCYKACWDTTCNACWDSTPHCGQNDRHM